ncbi:MULTISPECIES: DinB family protein [unclassified Modicisalibacter]|uniref:DinB family protein n=1 Tax=unclassified Modicisalibacter TaxID=2679913 RepID=UPI001CCE354A|nr:MULTISPECIES: DinB family protein [unclassified Modicisalibacter]MBZ9559982.1 DinB family protein [Modicisalibacter sp. R2A 31.J]MBZ9575891.1 DinB family protein [Modicisalibacter sp. MOD 31.J]
MTTLDHVRLLARYNAWMNERLYTAAARLPAEALQRDRGAFFGSLLGTLNHLAVADTIWLQRFATHPAQHGELEPVRRLPRPRSLGETLYADLEALGAYRHWLDTLIQAWCQALAPRDLEHVLRYSNTRGIAAHKPVDQLLLHFFNHQTHHRGQATTLLNQAGEDVGVTDLLALIDDV